MRPLTRDRRRAVICAGCAGILPGTAAVMSNHQLSVLSHSHAFATGIVAGVAAGLLVTSIIFLRRGRLPCSQGATD